MHESSRKTSAYRPRRRELKACKVCADAKVRCEVENGVRECKRYYLSCPLAITLAPMSHMPSASIAYADLHIVEGANGSTRSVLPKAMAVLIARISTADRAGKRTSAHNTISS